MSIFEAIHFKLLHLLCSELVNERVNNKSEATPGKMDSYLQVVLKLFAEFLKVCFLSDIYDRCYNKVLCFNVHTEREKDIHELNLMQVS